MERLATAVEAEQTKKPKATGTSANVKLLAALRKLVFETMPADPTRPEYQQGGTLGAARKHWFRAKFSGQRFRLFFRYDSRSKVIIYAWVNDGETLRTSGSKTDAYAMFRGMLDAGDPPDSWAALLNAASDADASKRLAAGPARPRPPADETANAKPPRSRKR